MMDQKSQIERQIGEFFAEFKNRAVQIQSYMGMPGSPGYTIKINRMDVESSLEIYLTPRFPYEAPICLVKPPFMHEILDRNGRVNDPILSQWNMNTSSLRNLAKELLNK